LNRLREHLPDQVLEEAWEGEGEIIQIAEEELPRLGAALGEDAERVLRYTGLLGKEAAWRV
jgi:hypothetical protein